jgi:putative hydrolase of the HAD superfamily
MQENTNKTVTVVIPIFNEYEGIPFLVDSLNEFFGQNSQLDAEVITGLTRASAAGWKTIVVTNGPTRQQEQKLRNTGLDRHVDGWVISEAVGVRKPDQRIFQAAADQAGLPLDGGWMLGDHPRADVGGGLEAGLSTGWIRRGRTWPVLRYQPTISADSFPEAISLMLAATTS